MKILSWGGKIARELATLSSRTKSRDLSNYRRAFDSFAPRSLGLRGVPVYVARRARRLHSVKHQSLTVGV
ncbi:MAG: hypothetical protein DME83_00240 [Verrucomicrobia bacterium]|nr:MAG: hypothetical protein DME83_00240 [Verrucomicrobiota bacterium]